MIIFIILLCALCLWKLKISAFHEDYLSKRQTGCMKGIFAIIIVFSHLRGYITLSSAILDSAYVFVLNLIGQLMVTVFFFYSGYGVMQSYKNKEDYSKGFFKNRILKTLIHFDIAVLCYLLLSLIIGVRYTWADYVFCWTGWTSVGNSNWFIFVAIALYMVTFFAFPIASLWKKYKPYMLALAVSVFSLILWVVLYLVGKESYWYNTLLCYAFGMWFALGKERIDDFLRKNLWVNYGSVVFSFILFAGAYLFLGKIIPSVIAYSIAACLFCLTLTLITTKIKVENPILSWLGKNSFWIYILQRLPMIIFRKIGWNSNVYIFTILIIFVTFGLVYVFNKLIEKIEKSNDRIKKQKKE